MSIPMPSESEQASGTAGDQQINAIISAVGHFIRKDWDAFRARAFWERTLETVPKEVIASALTIALSGNRYKEVPGGACGRCCCRKS